MKERGGGGAKLRSGEGEDELSEAWSRERNVGTGPPGGSRCWVAPVGTLWLSVCR